MEVNNGRLETIWLMGVGQKKSPPIKCWKGSWCPRLDSNQHVLTNTTPSRWRVYQFHHVGG